MTAVEAVTCMEHGDEQNNLLDAMTLFELFYYNSKTEKKTKIAIIRQNKSTS